MRATPGSVICVNGGVPEKPWPGRSIAVTRWVFARSGISARKEWVDAPVPWRRRMSGPSPMVCAWIGEAVHA